MKNKLRKALLERRVTLGGWAQIGHPAIAEVMASAGLDWFCVDLEHGAIGIESATNMFRALEGSDCVPVARLPENDPVWIRRLLDAGARGLIIPMVNTAEEASSAVSDAKYPPLGKRGFGYCRANTHGRDFEDYIAEANEEIPVVIQIEHIDAISNLDAIVSVEGVDGLFIGPYDLSGSMGLTGKLTHPDVQAVLRGFRDTCEKQSASAGIHVVEPNCSSIESAVSDGYTLIALGVDNVMLRTSMEQAISEVNRARQLVCS